MTKVKTHWYYNELNKFYNDNNDELVWGIDYIDSETDETIHCEWFKTRQERNNKFKNE